MDGPEPFSKDGFLFRRELHSPALILESGQAARAARYMKKTRITGLELNCSLGFLDDDLACLEHFPFLKHLHLLTGGGEDLGPVHQIRGLESLDISCQHNKSSIDFTQFPKLEDCFLAYWPRADSIFECTSLRHLYVNPYRGADATPFSRLVNLEALQIAISPIADLRPLATLQKLRQLEVHYMPKLKTLAGVDALSELRLLRCENCKSVTSLEPVAALMKLEVLDISDNARIDTLAPIRDLNNLEEVWFAGKTVIVDGDMTPLIRTPPLKRVGWKDRRTYSHKCRELPGAWAPSPGPYPLTWYHPIR